MTFRIAVIQPITHRPGEDERNVAEAVAHVAQAAAEGADFVCFPESYPGPWRMPAPYDPTAALRAAAQAHKVHVVYGTLEPISTATPPPTISPAWRFRTAGRRSRYRRTHPNGPWIYTGGTVWEFQYRRATNSRCSTPCTARSGSRCAARSTCRRSPARSRCAAPS